MNLTDLIKRGGLRGLATAIPATFATHEPFRPPTVATLATLAVATESPTMTALLDAAMHACDYWGDGEEASQQMREQCLSVPHHQRKELIEHFLKAYPDRKVGGR